MSEIKTYSEFPRLTYQICCGLEDLIEPLSHISSESSEEITSLKSLLKQVLTTYYNENKNKLVLDVHLINMNFLFECFGFEVIPQVE
jgi:hypothetical protein